MNNKNTEFDVGWAKRGGVVYGKYDFGGNYLFRLVDCHISRNEYLLYPLFCFEKMYNDRLGLRAIFLGSDAMERMATREECAAAGVEYIERPVSAEELADLRKDRVLLEYIIGASEFYVPALEQTSAGEFSLLLLEDNGGGVYLRDTYFEGATPREAIRAAMKGGV